MSNYFETEKRDFQRLRLVMLLNEDRLIEFEVPDTRVVPGAYKLEQKNFLSDQEIQAMQHHLNRAKKALSNYRKKRDFLISTTEE